jgi:hypothetical protein
VSWLIGSSQKDISKLVGYRQKGEKRVQNGHFGTLFGPLFDPFLDTFFDPFLAEIDAFQGAIWRIGGPKRGPKRRSYLDPFLTLFAILMPKVPKKRSFWDPFLTLFVTLAKGVFRGSILPLICGCKGLFWPSGQKGEKGVKKGS